MAKILLTWRDNSTTEDGQRVFRSDRPTAIDELGEPIAELAPDVTQYADADVEVGQVYYYRISAFMGEFEEFSAELRVAASSVRIVAPTNLLVRLVEPPPALPAAF